MLSLAVPQAVCTPPAALLLSPGSGRHVVHDGSSGAAFPPGGWRHADQRPAEHAGPASLPQTLGGPRVLNDFNAHNWRSYN